MYIVVCTTYSRLNSETSCYVIGLRYQIGALWLVLAISQYLRGFHEQNEYEKRIIVPYTHWAYKPVECGLQYLYNTRCIVVK